MTLIKNNPPKWHYLADAFNHDFYNDRSEFDEWTPAMNVIENEDNYEVELAVPGFKKEDFNVSIEDGMVLIEASSSKEKEEKTKKYTRKEFYSQSFRKHFAMPKNVNDSEIKAKYEDGVLRLVLAKNVVEALEKKRISIS